MGTEVIRVPMGHVPERDDVGGHIFPPEGDGYALWQNTSDVMYSPVFATLRELCDWAAEHNYISVNDPKLTSDEWYEKFRGWVGE